MPPLLRLHRGLQLQAVQIFSWLYVIVDSGKNEAYAQLCLFVMSNSKATQHNIAFERASGHKNESVRESP